MVGPHGETRNGRPRRILAAAATLLAFALLIGCAGNGSGDIASVRIDGSACPDCMPHLVVKATGTVEDGASPPRTVPVSRPALARTILESLPLSEFAIAPREGTASTAASVVVTFRDGRYRQAMVPIGDEAPASILRFQLWAKRTERDATDALLRSRRVAFASGIQEHKLRSIVLVRTACYGFCPAYTVTFQADGVASIHDVGPQCSMTASARVPFERVEDAAEMAGVGYLLPSYEMKWVDTPGATISFSTDRSTYRSVGADSMTWSSAFLASVSRLDQIVRDTSWTPRIDLKKCAGAPRQLGGILAERSATI